MWAQQALQTPDIVVPCDYIANAMLGCTTLVAVLADM